MSFSTTPLYDIALGQDTFNTWISGHQVAYVTLPTMPYLTSGLTNWANAPCCLFLTVLAKYTPVCSPPTPTFQIYTLVPPLRVQESRDVSIKPPYAALITPNVLIWTTAEAQGHGGYELYCKSLINEEGKTGRRGDIHKSIGRKLRFP